MRKRASAWILAITSAFIAACVPPVEPGAEVEAAPFPRGDSEVLIFAGASSWRPEIRSLSRILTDHGISVEESTSPQLDAMSFEQLSEYSLLVFPGGNSIAMAASLSSDTHLKIRRAVRENGVSYLGFCAGAWAAIGPGGFEILAGPTLAYNYLSRDGRSYAMSRAEFPDGSRRDLLWYGGPITPDAPGGVVAKYPDGTPAITQLRAGQGFVILSGLHPAAVPEVISDLSLSDSDGLDHDLAWKMLDSAIRRKAMNAF